MSNKSLQAIAAKLRQIRQKKGMTQLDVAKAADISINFYARIERAESVPSVAVLEKLVKALKVKSSDILPF